jgi:hypothetical protein
MTTRPIVTDTAWNPTNVNARYLRSCERDRLTGWRVSVEESEESEDSEDSEESRPIVT